MTAPEVAVKWPALISRLIAGFISLDVRGAYGGYAHCLTVKLQFDKARLVSQYFRMSRPFKKFVSVLLAVWLPLFSGNALAMQTKMLKDSAECPSATKQQDHSAHHSGHDMAQDSSASDHTQQNSSCNNCGACHFACSGYVSTAPVMVVPVQFDPLSYPPLSTPFLSFIPLLSDPPPLAFA